MRLNPSTVERLQADSSEEIGTWMTMARLSGKSAFFDLALRWNKEMERYQFVIVNAYRDEDEDDFIWLGTDDHDEASMLFAKHYVKSNF